MSKLSEAKGANWEPDFVSSLLFEESFDYYMAEGVDDRLLPDYQVRSIWHWAKEYRERSGKVPTLDAMVEEFPKYDFVEPRAEPHFILDKLKEKWQTKHLQSFSTDLATTWIEKGRDAAYDFARNKVFENEDVVSSKRIGSNFDSFEDMWLKYETAVESGMRRGFTLGFDPLDEHTGGIQRGQLVFLVARSKRFKSWFLLQAFLEQVRRGKNPILFTLELSETEMEERIWAMLSGVSYTDIVRGNLEWSQKEQIKQAMYEFAELTEGRGYRVHQPWGQRTVPELMAEADRRGADSILIDQLSFIDPRKEHIVDWGKFKEIAYDLKGQASGRPGKEMPIYVAHQMGRGQDSEEEIDAINIAGSDEVLRVADLILGLYRTKEMEDNNLVAMQVVEARSAMKAKFYVEVELHDRTGFEMHDRGEFPLTLTVDPSVVA